MGRDFNDEIPAESCDALVCGAFCPPTQAPSKPYQTSPFHCTEGVSLCPCWKETTLSHLLRLFVFCLFIIIIVKDNEVFKIIIASKFHNYITNLMVNS